MWGRQGRWLAAGSRSRVFVAGVLSGIVLVVAGRYAINRTSLADAIIAPLLRPDTAGRADVIVVPGAGVVGDCTPNVNGTRRVLLAARLFRASRAPLMLFTGGRGDGDCPVAEAMARQAQEVGVPGTSILIEPSSRSTYENAALSVATLDAAGARRLLLVTDRLHMPRVEQVFGHFGYQVERASVPIYEGHANNVDMLQAGLREYVALASYRWRGWLAPAAPRRVGAARVEPAMTGTLAHPEGPIVLLGASYAAGWPVERIAGRLVINRGVAGEVSTALRDRFQRDVVAAAPRAVVLWGFINDIFRAPAEMEPVLARIRNNYTEMIAAARAAGIEPILVTEVTARPPFRTVGERVANLVAPLLGRRAYQDHINQQVLAMDDWLRELAGREGLLLLDFQAALAEEGGRRHTPFSQPDGSHITAAGYDALTAYASPLLETHFRDH